MYTMAMPITTLPRTPGAPAIPTATAAAMATT